MSKEHKTLRKAVWAGGAAAYFYLQNSWIQKTPYQISLENLELENDGMKIALLSDLHIPNQKIDLKKLTKMIQSEKPDFIFLVGDQVDAGKPFYFKKTKEFLTGLKKIAPVYAVHGNHDEKAPNAKLLGRLYKESGTTLLEEEAYSVLAPNRKPLVIMGVGEPSNLLKKQVGDLLSKVRIRDDWKGQTRLLLAHRPENFERYHLDSAKAPDLTFSGHAHGGQIRIPKVGGLYAPGQGKMPKHTAGVFALPNDQSKKLVVSRGLGPSQFPLRINNRPELIMVTLKKA